MEQGSETMRWLVVRVTGHAPGVHDIGEAEYFADPALSCSGAKLLLPPSCPALFKWRQDHPERKDVFDFGSAAHKIVLGAGPEWAVVDAADWKTKAARDRRDEIRADGETPVLIGDLTRIETMASAIRWHPLASQLLDPANLGKPEQSLFWADEETGVLRRARLDWLIPAGDFGRVIAVDYKTCVSADPDAIAKATANFGYYMQADWYCDGIRALGLDDDPAFLFVFQEKEPPHLVTVAELDDEARRIGRARNRQALERFRDCAEADVWPGHSDEIEYISLPPWAARALGVTA